MLRSTAHPATLRRLGVGALSPLPVHLLSFGAQHGIRRASSVPPSPTPTCTPTPTTTRTRTRTPTPTPPPAAATTTSRWGATTTWRFWRCRTTWLRAGTNTFRCLVGCTLGDLGMLWYLQHRGLVDTWGMHVSMGLSMTSGIATSLLVETLLLRYGPTRMPLGQAASTAMGMSLISMLAMESVETAVNLHLTSSLSSSLSSSSSGIDLASPAFWLAALLSASAGFLAPLPYNYWRIKIYGRACH
ncbi:uncharacterized protein PFL1_01856 [Pseudozyma flocculosa PF-1]|uniref:uncharacterized protein n=1 Tax=Pseudozyma flocculosa PF-1 TaxID=1277687 RepID=UPI0004560143|nr:uncharacterized protein PFL1_01856 [Pseudozyma flocculosa PF-1]EPQ30330.1 hypothetical protein PFL1_01856 [Pseudozyma flocculosa PF-1]